MDKCQTVIHALLKVPKVELDQGLLHTGSTKKLTKRLRNPRSPQR